MTEEMKSGTYNESVREIVKPKPINGAIKAIYNMMPKPSGVKNSLMEKKPFFNASKSFGLPLKI